MTQRQSSTCNMPIFTKKFSFGDSFVFATCCIRFGLQFEFVFSHEAGKNGVDFQCRNVFTVFAMYSLFWQTVSATVEKCLFFPLVWYWVFCLQGSIFPASALVNLRFSQMFTQMQAIFVIFFPSDLASGAGG